MNLLKLIQSLFTDPANTGQVEWIEEEPNPQDSTGEQP